MPRSADADEPAPGDAGMKRRPNVLTNAWYRVIARLHAGSVAVYAGVASLIGVDAVALVISSAAVWPVGIPLLLGLLGFVYYLRIVRPRRKSDHVEN